MTDAELLSRCGAGDRDGCSGFVDRYERAVYRYALAITGDPVAAEDVLQDAFLAALRGAAGFRGDEEARAWLFAIVRNAASRRHRRRAGEPAHAEPLLDLGLAAGWGDPEAGAMASEDAAMVQRALGRLSDADREIVTLRDLEGLSGAEVAEILEIPLAAAKTRLHRARLRLVAALAGEGVHGA